MGPALDAAEARFGPSFAAAEAAVGSRDRLVYLVTAVLATLLAMLCLRPSRARKARACKKDGARKGPTPKQAKAARQQAAAAPPPKQKKKKRLPKVRMCRFCEVAVPKDDMMAAHLSGKKHRKLAGARSADECWVWVEKEEEELCEVAPTQEATPSAAVLAAAKAEEGWEQIPARKKREKPRPAEAEAAPKAKAAAAAAAPAPPPVVLDRCEGCGAMNTLLEADPEDETVGYCRACWRSWNNAITAPAPEPEAAATPAPHVTRWDGS